MGRIITSNRVALGLSAVALTGGTYAIAAGGNSRITVCVKKHGGSLYKARKAITS